MLCLMSLFVLKTLDNYVKLVITFNSAELSRYQIRYFNQLFVMLEQAGKVSVRERFEIKIAWCSQKALN